MYNHDYNLSRSLSNFMAKVYGWMSGALIISGLTAYAVYVTPELFSMFVMNRASLMIMMLVQVGLVMGISAGINRLSFSVASLLFALYALTLGVTLSTIFAVYTMASIYKVFAITTLMFGSMAVFGYVTRADLSRMGMVFTMGLWGLLIAMVINIFTQSSAFEMLISIVAVILFTGITAYDVQQIKFLGMQMIGQGEAEDKAALVGALKLYLDFINLFIHLLHLLGNRKN